MPDAIIFDLDGTLADTLHGIARTLNRVLDQFGLPSHPPEAYRRFVGNGVHKLVERALPPDQAHRTDEVLAVYRPLLHEHGAALSTVYAGIEPMLDALAQRRIPLAVLSNKPHDATVDVVNKLLGAGRFAEVRGHVEGRPVKPDPTVPRELLDRLDADPARSFYVGDSDVDVQTARNTGMVSVGVAWGLRGRAELEAEGADHVIDAAAELLNLVDHHGG